MKKFYAILCIALASLTQLQAQAPQGFNYQATVRNSSGDLIINTNVYFKFNVIQGSQTAVPIFTETHYVPTDDLGQVNLVIGQGTANTGIFSEMDWSLGSYYLGIELDTGSGYVAMGTTQLLSVPYALYAENSGNSKPNLQSVLAENNSAGQQQIKDLLDPTDAQDAVTKAYADALSNTQGLMNFNEWDNYQILNDNTTFQLEPNSFVFLDANNTTLIFPDGSENGFGDAIYIYVVQEASVGVDITLQPSGFPIRIPAYDQPSYDNYYGILGCGLNTIINVGDYWMVADFQGQIIPDSDIDDDGDGFTENQGDCDDNDAQVNPGATEIIDGIDNDCDGYIDGAFPVAPTPTLAASKVISIFSDAYTDVPVNYYNGFWEPYQTTLGGETIIDGQNVLNYTEFNFVGTQLTTPLDISDMTHLSIDILMPEVLPTNIDMLLTIKNENTAATTFQQQRIGGQTYQWDTRTGDINDTQTNATFAPGGAWKTIKIPIRPTTETSLDKTGVNLIIIENIKSSNVTNFHIDNLYFFRTGSTTILSCTADEVQTLNAENFHLTFLTDPGTSASNNTENFKFYQDDTVYEYVDNPGASAGNNSCKVGKVTNGNRNYWDNLQFDFANKLTFTDGSNFTMKVYSPQSGYKVTLKLEDKTNPGVSTEVASAATTKTNEWEEVTISFNSADSGKYDKIIFFFDLETKNGNTYYFDDVKLNLGTGGSGGGNPLAGTWRMAPTAGAFGVGPAIGDISWFSNATGDLTTRACFFDDEYVFNADGSFQNVLGADTFLEAWQGTTPDACGTPVFPHDGTATATYAYDETAGTITIDGKGAFLGLAKVNNAGELAAPGDAPDSITYDVTEFDEAAGTMTLDINFGPGYWRYKLVKQ